MPQQAEILTRLAPTPSGFLHLGNIFNFLMNWLYARSRGGKVLLRIDDLDADRVKPEYLDDVFRVLELMGLDWDIGPSGPDNFRQEWSQKLRTDRYEELLKRLQDKGLMYACDCSRSSLLKMGFSGAYPGLCREKMLEYRVGATALRMNLEKAGSICREKQWTADMDLCGAAWQGNLADPVLRRRDGIPAYHVGSVCDDVYFGVTHVFRGLDLLESTVLQRLLACVAGECAFLDIRFGHHPLIKGKDGLKLSKSAGAGAVIPLSGGEKEVRQTLEIFARWQGFSGDTEHLTQAGDLLHAVSGIWNPAN